MVPRTNENNGSQFATILISAIVGGLLSLYIAGEYNNISQVLTKIVQYENYKIIDLNVPEILSLVVVGILLTFFTTVIVKLTLNVFSVLSKATFFISRAFQSESQESEVKFLDNYYKLDQAYWNVIIIAIVSFVYVKLFLTQIQTIVNVIPLFLISWSLIKNIKRIKGFKRFY